MINKDKVLIGLGQHISSRTPERCGTCPYFNGDYGYGISCRDELLDDLYELLEAQEPRLLTLEEAQGQSECWLEIINSCVRVADIVMSAETIDGMNVSEVFTIGTDFQNPSFVIDDEYGIKWRCWDKKPTDEERRATPWKNLT